jgi:hypothetical protein
VERAARRVHRNLVVIDAEPVALRVAVGEQSRLQHLVGREADAGHDVGRIEGRLLDFGKKLSGLRFSSMTPDFDQRVVLVWPDLGQVEGMVGHLRRVGSPA